MSAVTIRGRLGSGASEIGIAVAHELHIDYVDREIIAEVADRLQCSEQKIAQKEMPSGTLFERIAEALGTTYTAGVGYSVVYLPVAEMLPADTHYLAGLESVIRTLAGSQSIVIQGRGSQFILKDFPNTFHVMVVAPLELRLKRVGQDMKLSEEAASREIASYDGSRREFIKRYFNAEREDPIHYDLVINTGRLNYEDAASIVVNAVPRGT